MVYSIHRSYWVVLAALTGCAASIPPQMSSVAQRDLACDRVEITEAGSDRYAASGCGRGAVYARSCSDAGCGWSRLPGNEIAPPPATSGSEQATAAAPREVIPAPPPAQREVIPAPPPAESSMRQVIPAPPPPATADQSQPQGAAQGTASDAQQPYSPQPTPLSQGELSNPYPTEVPATPVMQRSEYPPPAPLVEQRAVAPAPNYIWVSGYWWWNQPSWVWAPGYWCPPRYGYGYVPSSWYWAGGSWWFGPGGWARPGSTYVVHHVYPRPNRVQVTRSFTPYHHVTGYAAGRAAPRAVQSYTAPRSYAPMNGYGPSRGYAPSQGFAAGRYVGGRPRTEYAPSPSRGVIGSQGYAPSRGLAGNDGYAPSGGVVGSQGYGRAPVQGAQSFTPQSSPLYRYPSRLTNPMQAPRGNGSAVIGSRGTGPMRAPSHSMTGYGAGRGFSGAGSVAPSRSPVYRSAPAFRERSMPAPRSIDTARGRAFGGGGGGFHGNAAPLRGPSGGGGAPRGARIAPRR